MGIRWLWPFALALSVAGCNSGGEVAPPPAAPQANASAQDSVVLLEWPAQSDAVSYNVYWSTTPGVTTAAPEALRNVMPPVQHTGLTNGLTYNYVVTAVGAGGESSPSQEVSATPQPAPAAPAGVTATAGDEQVAIAWNPVPGATTYRVLVTDEADNAMGGTPATTSETSYTLGGLTNGVTLRVRLTAVNGSGESAASQSVSVIPTRLLEVAVGTGHLCALRSTRSLWCWGSNDLGELGNGQTSADPTSEPQLVSGAGPWTSTSVGVSHSCGTKQDGSVWCWGDNVSGQLATALVDSSPEPRPIELPANDITRVTSGAGAQHSCALSEQGSLWCWGNNFFGQVGNDSTDDPAAPALIGEADVWHSVAVGSLHTCAIKKDGTLWCWGANFLGQLGDGSFTDRLLPTPVAPDKTWSVVAASLANTCAIESGGALWCWGFNDSGQVGDGTFDMHGEPAAVLGDALWRDVASGSAFTCALKDDLSLWCWGMNGAGQLADGTNESRSEPTATIVAGPWAKIFAGEANGCAQRASGELYCWGSTDFGLLGATSPTGAASPAAIGVP